jgi:transcriptional regulator with XRE-family HTH domain
VQRSSISHILSGRNKPSLDFLEKILGAYPKYNAEWLVMGTGQVYKAPKQSSLFDVQPDKTSEEDIMVKSAQSVEENIDSQDADISNDETLNLYGKSNAIKKLDKAIEKVLFFYTDGTFSVYLPNE